MNNIRAQYGLSDPLEGIENHQDVVIAVEETPETAQDWRALRGSLPAEAAEDIRGVLIAARADED